MITWKRSPSSMPSGSLHWWRTGFANIQETKIEATKHYTLNDVALQLNTTHKRPGVAHRINLTIVVLYSAMSKTTTPKQLISEAPPNTGCHCRTAAAAASPVSLRAATCVLVTHEHRHIHACEHTLNTLRATLLVWLLLAETTVASGFISACGAARDEEDRPAEHVQVDDLVCLQRWSHNDRREAERHRQLELPDLPNYAVDELREFRRERRHMEQVVLQCTAASGNRTMLNSKHNACRYTT